MDPALLPFPVAAGSSTAAVALDECDRRDQGHANTEFVPAPAPCLQSGLELPRALAAQSIWSTSSAGGGFWAAAWG